MNDVLCWVYKHETLFSGLLAVCAALGTIGYLWRQHVGERRRRFDAARAVSTLALSQLCEYASKSISFAVAGRNAMREGRRFVDEVPMFAEDLILTFKDLIEYGDASIASAVQELMKEIQVQRSRLTDPPRGEASETHSGVTKVHTEQPYNKAVYDAAHLHAHASKFFDFARSRTNAPPVTPEQKDVMHSLLLNEIEQHAFPEVYSYAGV